MNEKKNIKWHKHSISKEDRISKNKQKPCILWFTGLSASGKSTIANTLEKKLFSYGYKTYLLDGDNIRHGLNKDLGFTDIDRVENIRRIGEVAKLFVDAGIIVLSAFISPFKSDRQIVRSLVGHDEFIEIFVNTPIEVCEARDPKGLYKKARNGAIKHFTGIDSPYEQPSSAEIELITDINSAESCAEKVLQYLMKHNYISEKIEEIE